MDGCVGNARCNLRLSERAKMSVDVSYLPDALRRGARVISDALVERITSSAVTRRACPAGC
jgi:hypothetical protein